MTQAVLDALTIDDAVKTANEIERLEAVLKSMKEKLKAFVDKNGALETKDKVWDYVVSVSWEFQPEQLKEMAQDIVLDGRNPWELLDITSTNLKKLGWSDDVLEQYGKKKETKRFVSRKK